MMMTFITQGGEGRGKTNKEIFKERKATKSKGRGLEEGASRALMRQVGEEGCGGRGSHNRYNVSSVPQAALEDPVRGALNRFQNSCVFFDCWWALFGASTAACSGRRTASRCNTSSLLEALVGGVAVAVLALAADCIGS
jgi:hypothetical protein